jgi:hypothetical protein
MTAGPRGQTCYILAADEGQAGDDLDLVKKLIAANPKALGGKLLVRRKRVVRRDGRGFLEILPAQDVSGAHGKSYSLVGFDEVHTQRTWDLLEAMQLDPNRGDALMWLTSYASIHHAPGVPLFDLMKAGKTGADPRMLFSWYGADFTTDPAFAEADPGTRANPSRDSWADQGYLAQQARRLPAHQYRRLHLNLPGMPAGSAFKAEPVMDAVARGVFSRPYEPGVQYVAFCNHSHGSDDDATLAIGHVAADTRLVVDVCENQKMPVPFSMFHVIPRFATKLREYHVSTVTGDAVGGETYRQTWRDEGIEYRVSSRTTSEQYEGLEAPLNNGMVQFPDVPLLEQQLLGLVWKGAKITHPSGEHDDLATAAAGCVMLLARRGESFTPFAWSETTSTQQKAAAFWAQRAGGGLSHIDGDSGGLVANPRGELERYRDARGDEPAERPVIAHNVENNAHRSVCRQCSRDYIKFLEANDPHRPSGRSATSRDPRGLERWEPHCRCLGCGQTMLRTTAAQQEHLGRSPRCVERWHGFSEEQGDGTWVTRVPERTAPTLPTFDGWTITPSVYEPSLRVVYACDACGKNGNLLRANLAAFVADHQRERHP